jgi:post-segregation antitoxin (ccd killing protein)
MVIELLSMTRDRGIGMQRLLAVGFALPMQSSKRAEWQSG